MRLSSTSRSTGTSKRAAASPSGSTSCSVPTRKQDSTRSPPHSATRFREQSGLVVIALGRDFVDEPGPLPFGTDFGNVSQRVPAALIGIGRPGGWAFHTDEGAAQFEQDGIDAALTMARVLALAATRLTER